jgi:hypothetical protein
MTPKRALIVILFPAIASTAAPQAQAPRPLHFVAAITDYYHAEYVPLPEPPARHVFFVGEAIDVRLSIGNRGATAQELNTRNVSIEKAFALSVLEQPAGSGSIQFVPVTRGEIKSEERNTTTVDWNHELEVPAQSSLTFAASIVMGSTAVPGQYSLRIMPGFAGTTEPINPLGSMLRFELRPVDSLGARAELVRRRMVRAYQHDDASAAQTASESLLRSYPSSAQAYQVKGEIARRSGRTQEAVAAFDRAVALIQSGADKLYLQHASPEAVEQTVRELTRSTDSLRERKNQ